MKVKNLSASIGGPVHVEITAGYLELAVHIVRDATVATLSLKGGKAAEKATAIMAGSSWKVEIPNRGMSSGGVSISGANYQSMSFSSGRVSGRMVVSGVDVTDYVRQQQAEQGTGEIKGTLVLPGGSTLATDTEDGHVQVSGFLPMANLKTVSGGIYAERCGTALATNVSGPIELAGVTTTATATNVSGSIKVHAEQSIPVTATNVSGDIYITAAPGMRPMVSTSNVSGRTRKP